MRLSYCLTLLLLIHFNTLAFPEDIVREESCQIPDANEAILYAEEFSGSFSLQKLKDKEHEINTSGMRLNGRAYVSEGKLIIPHANYPKSLINIPDIFIQSIVRHVEVAFERNYIDALIFPDMGHSHFFIEMDHYNNSVQPYVLSDRSMSFENMFSHPETKILYHTAEKMEIITKEGELSEDRHMQWRFYTRNLVGDNTGRGDLNFIFNHDHSANTAHSYGAGYRYWGAGFNISISEKGCFSFQRNGRTFYFDISLKDLPYRSSSWDN